jgi:hypothetical protein
MIRLQPVVPLSSFVHLRQDLLALLRVVEKLVS